MTWLADFKKYYLVNVQASKLEEITVRRFFRPEDISPDTAYRSSYFDVLASSETVDIDVDLVIRPCKVVPEGEWGTDSTIMPRHSQAVHVNANTLIHFDQLYGLGYSK